MASGRLLAVGDGDVPGIELAFVSLLHEDFHSLPRISSGSGGTRHSVPSEQGDLAVPASEVRLDW
jgi:hypothetical protein